VDLGADVHGRFLIAFWALALAATLSACGPDDQRVSTDGDTSDPPPQPAAALPGLRVVEQLGGTRLLYGATMATGDSALQSAAALLETRADLLGVDPAQLVREAPGVGGVDGVQGLMFDRDSGRYRMSLVRYRQELDGVPVFGAGLGVLVREDAHHPAIMAKSTLRTIDGPVLRPARERLRPELANAAVEGERTRTDLKGELLPPVDPGLSAFSDRRAVIWAGHGPRDELPRAAIEFVADNSGTPDAPRPERWRFVADAATGEILYKESLISFDVAGDVGGMATTGDVEMRCGPEAVAPMPYATVGIDGGATTTSDVDGNFVIPHVGNGNVTVQSPVSGVHFQVVDASGGDELLEPVVAPPGPVSIVHNQANVSETVRAQANAYVQANGARDWLLSHHPTYVFDQGEFPITVNRTDELCPGNAWYDLGAMHFCLAEDQPNPLDTDYGNTAFGDIVNHEYGHHLVTVAGSGQGAYGEGMGDVVAVLMADNPEMGEGFFLDDCGTPLRTADNTCQHIAGMACSDCGDEIHDCGNVLSGAVWDLREAIGVSDPGGALDIVSGLAVNAMLLHRGDLIEPQITIDYLLLDDDDDNFDNGSPHRDEICAAFGAHNLPCPSPALGMTVTPVGEHTSAGNLGGPFTPSMADYTVENLGPGSMDYTVSVDQPWLTLGNAAGTLAVGATAAVQATVDGGMAAALGRGAHVATLTFTNGSTGVGNTTRSFVLAVAQETILDFPLDTDPGWTTTGAWAFGAPQGGGGATGGDSYGAPDPSAGFTGNNVYGYNLAGNYANDLPARHLTTTALDFTDITHVQLNFKRWLCVETSVYDQATVSVSTDGSSFQTVWSNAETLPGGAWLDQTLDLSDLADDESTVYIRWTMGATDGGWNFCGWNIDDIEITGIDANGGCMVDGNCDDGLACNGAEVCNAGVCERGTAVDCDDSVACTQDACSEPSGSCQHTASDAACDNGQFCDGIESCDDSAGCLSGTPPGVDDGVACTLDSCDEGADAVVHTTSDAACDNGAFCDGAERCDANAGCQAGTPPVTDDGVACTADSCDEAADAVVHAADDGACDDGQFCDGAETCDALLGCRPGAAPATDDGVACTVDGCDEAADMVTHLPSDAACDNGAYCDGAETCDAQLGCRMGPEVNCSDGVGCTVDRCDEASDSCTFDPAHGACDNGLFCDGIERCDQAQGCVAGTPPGADDGVGCTDVTCDEGTDSIGHAPVDANCDNGLFCDGLERCDAVAGCLAGSAPDPSDGVDCTVDTCDEDARSALNLPDDSVCDNGVFCDGIERCDAVRGCQVAEPRELDDGVDCTVDSCDEEAAVVEHTPDDVLCDNALFCDGEEVCHPQDGCEAAEPPCEDGDACTDDACDEELAACGESTPIEGCDPGEGELLPDGGTTGDGEQVLDADASMEVSQPERPSCGCRTLGATRVPTGGRGVLSLLLVALCLGRLGRLRRRRV